MELRPRIYAADMAVITYRLDAIGAAPGPSTTDHKIELIVALLHSIEADESRSDAEQALADAATDWRAQRKATVTNIADARPRRPAPAFNPGPGDAA